MRIGIDVGGTFTDIVAIADDGEVAIRKVPSTVDDYSRAIAEALPPLFAAQQRTGRSVREVLHATTLATNAILQHLGARTAFDHHAGIPRCARASAHADARNV